MRKGPIWFFNLQVRLCWIFW